MTSRTRYLAGTVAALATTLAAMPFVGAGSASAATEFAEITDTSWYTGQTYDLTFTQDAGDVSGPFAVALFDGTSATAHKIATLKTGFDATAFTGVSWTIPTGVAKLIDTGLEIRLISTVVDTDGSALFAAVPAGETVDIAKSSIADVALASSATSITGGGTATVEWTALGETGPTVDINLLKTAGGKTTKVTLEESVANSTDADAGTAGIQESEAVDIPAALTAGTGTYQIEVVPANKSAVKGASDPIDGVALTVSAPTFSGTVYQNASVNVTPVGASATNPLDVVLREKVTKKAVATLAKGVTSTTAIPFAVPMTLSTTSATYELVSISSKDKALVSTGTAFNITGLVKPSTVHLSSTSANQGQAITITWAATSQQTNSIVLIGSDSKETKVATGVKTNASGAGSYYWIVPSNLKPGSYTVKVRADLLKKTDANYESSVSNPTLTVVANETKLT